MGRRWTGVGGVDAGRTDGQRRAIVRRWERSGDAAVDFAPTVGVSMGTLYAWRKRLRAGVAAVDAPGGDRPSAVPLFVELVPGADRGGVEVVLGGGRVVRVRSGFDAALLRRVVAALEGGELGDTL